MTQEIVIHDQIFVLHPSGAVYWPARQTLLISDVHLGKVSHFRKNGIAVPAAVAEANFVKLRRISKEFSAERILFMGDLFHSHKNNEWQPFADWVAQTSARLILVSGNHDVIAEHHYQALGIEVVSEWQSGAFLLTHYPETREGFFNFCGHIHPAVELRGPGRQSMRLPCFFQRPDQLILPAFGNFTGTYALVPDDGDCVYALADNRIVRVC